MAQLHEAAGVAAATSGRCSSPQIAAIITGVAGDCRHDSVAASLMRMAWTPPRTVSYRCAWEVRATLASTGEQRTSDPYVVPRRGSGERWPL